MKIHFTQRALADLEGIYEYTAQQWGTLQADKYIEDIQNSLNIIADNPGLLQVKTHISNRFIAHQIKHYWFVCDLIENNIYVLTIKHVSSNLWERLRDLEPNLEQEAGILAKQLEQGPNQ